VGSDRSGTQSVGAFQKHFEAATSLSLGLAVPLAGAATSSIRSFLVWSKFPGSVPLPTFFNFQRAIHSIYKIILSFSTGPIKPLYKGLKGKE